MLTVIENHSQQTSVLDEKQQLLFFEAVGHIISATRKQTLNPKTLNPKTLNPNFKRTPRQRKTLNPKPSCVVLRRCISDCTPQKEDRDSSSKLQQKQNETKAEPMFCFCFCFLAFVSACFAVYLISFRLLCCC